MANFIITFPQADKTRRDGWVLVINAKSVEQVRNFAEHEYKAGFSYIYDEDNFHDGYFPKGCLDQVDFRSWHDYVV